MATACIIPDNDIEVRPARTNPGAVRIVEAVAITPEAVAACAQVPIAGEPVGESLRETCPLPPITVPTGLIRLEGQTLCLCPEGQVDGGALGGFDIYVEDPDVESDGSPSDDLYGVFLLDVPPEATDVTRGGFDLHEFVAYTNYLDPEQPARLVPLPVGSYVEPIERPPTNLKSWSLGVDERVDFCNNNEGAPLPEPGLHSLMLVVTDRPWYVPVKRNQLGAPERKDGVLQRDGLPLVGVPDLPGGASYAVAHYVFECLTEDVAPEVDVCDCVNPTEES